MKKLLLLPFVFLLCESYSDGQSPTLKTYSKYDFTPGEKVVLFEDFSQDAVGDFPARWTTNGSGEVMTVDQHEGHWLSVSKEGFYVPTTITGLPDNFTLEFDVLYIPLAEMKGPNTAEFGFEIFEQLSKKEPFSYHVNKATFSIDPRFAKFDICNGFRLGGHPTIENGTPIENLDRHRTFAAHVAVWRQKSRVRVYIGENKVCDAPSILGTDARFNAIRFVTPQNNDGSTWLLGNVKLAVGAPDTRNKLLTTGKWSTTGILFDVSSAKIRAESWGTLQQIAQALKESPDLKVNIVGHTDSDGADAANLSLSKARAESVKASLKELFGIDPGRMQCDGKGRTQPVAPNTTPEGKAANRRVEFIKI